MTYNNVTVSGVSDVFETHLNRAAVAAILGVIAVTLFTPGAAAQAQVPAAACRAG